MVEFGIESFYDAKLGEGQEPVKDKEPGSVTSRKKGLSASFPVMKFLFFVFAEFKQKEQFDLVVVAQIRVAMVIEGNL